MAFNVSNFVAKLATDDVARSNLYYVAFPDMSKYMGGTTTGDGVLSPTDLINTSTNEINYLINQTNMLLNTNNIGDLVEQTETVFSTSTSNDELGFMCKAINLPNMTHEIEQDKLMYRKTVNNFIAKHQGTVTATFYLSPDHRERRIMTNWFKSIYNSDTCEVEFPSVYQKKIEVVLVDRSGKGVVSVTLKKAFPISIGEVQLGYENNNEISTFECEFAIENAHYSSVVDSNLEPDVSGTLDSIDNAVNSISSGLSSFY